MILHKFPSLWPILADEHENKGENYVGISMHS